jgi:hypothetical protein
MVIGVVDVDDGTDVVGGDEVDVVVRWGRLLVPLPLPQAARASAAATAAAAPAALIVPIGSAAR